MKKSALFKTSLREIIHSPTRFLSIFGIIFLGVAFFVGIGATGPDMLNSGDVYYKNHQLADATIMSTLGLAEADVEAVKEDHLVDQVQAQYFTDIQLSEKNLVLRLLGYREDEPLNHYQVKEGRLPAKSGEIAIDQLAQTRGRYQIGDTIKIKEEDDPAEGVKTKEMKIVGFVTSPEFIENVKRGNTNVGSGSIDYFVVIPEEDLTLPAYTRLLVSFKGTKETAAYSDAYDDAVASGINSLKKGLAKRPEARLSEVKKAAESQLAEVQKKLTEGEKQLDEAQDKLTAAKKTLDDGQKELDQKKAEAQQQFAEGEAKLAEQQKQLDAQKAQLDTHQKQLDDYKTQMNSDAETAKKQLTQLQEEQSSLTKAVTGLQTLVDSMTAVSKYQGTMLEDQITSRQGTWLNQVKGLPHSETLTARITDLANGPTANNLQRAITSGNNLAQSYQSQNTQLTEEISRLTAAADITALTQALETSQKQVDQARQELTTGETQLATAKKELADKKTAAEKELQENQTKLDNGKKDYEKNFAAFQEQTGETIPKLTEAESQIKSQQEKLAAMKTPEYSYNDREAFPGYVDFRQNADRISSLATVFPIIFFLIAALVSLTTMTRMVEEKRSEIGTFKALGYRNGEIAQKFLLYSLLAGVTGSVAGLALGFYVFPSIIINAYGQLYSIKDFQTPWYWQYALIGLGVGLLCTVVVTMLVLRLDLFSTPASLMRPKAPKAGKRVLLEGIKPVWKRLSFIQKVTMRNLFRYKSRMFMTIFGIAGCTSMIITGFGIRDSISDIVPLQFEKLWHYQAIVTRDDAASEEAKEKYQQELQGLNRFDKELPISMETLTLSGKGETPQDVTVYVPEQPQDLSDFILLNDRETGEKFSLKEEGAVIDEKLAQLFALKKGDTIKLENADQERFAVKVAAIAENYTGHFAYLTPTYYEKVFGKEPTYSGDFLLFKEALTNKQEKAVAEELMGNASVLNVSFLSTSLHALDETTGTLNIVVWVLIISAGLLALIVLYNLNNINISERIRELSTIKVLGFYNNELTMYIYRENILLTVIGIAVGLLLGIVEHRFVLQTVEMDMLMFSPKIHGLSFVYATLITLFFTLMVGIVVYFKLKRVDMIEALKSNE